MRVEALTRENGIFIPLTEELSHIKSKKILLEIKVIEHLTQEDKQSQSASDIFGLFKHRKLSKPVSIEEMEAAILKRRKQ